MLRIQHVSHRPPFCWCRCVNEIQSLLFLDAREKLIATGLALACLLSIDRDLKAEEVPVSRAMRASFLQCPSIPLLSLTLLLLQRFLPVSPFSAHDNLPRKFSHQTPKASSPQQPLSMPEFRMKAELVLNHKATPDERDLVCRIEFLQSQGISSFAIANTDKKDREAMPRWIEALRKLGKQRPAGFHISAQYSLKQHSAPKGGLSGKQTDFLQTLKDSYSGADEILLVSGNYGPEPRAWKTVDALSALFESKEPLKARIAVGYNPYHFDPAAQDRENARLLAELATGCVSRIYLNFGTDLDKLKTGIGFCRNAATTMVTAKDEGSNNVTQISMVGSLFLPTPQRITQQKTRPWKGVMLGPEFKSDPSGQQASALVSEMVKLYQKHDIELLWEAPGIWSQDETDTITKILDGAVSSETEANECQVTVKDTGDVSGDSKDTPIHSLSGHFSMEDDIKLDAPSQLQQTDDFSEDTCILIFGSHDVRLQDNQALEEAFNRHEHVLPVFFYTREEREGLWGCPENTAVAVCLEDALQRLQTSLESFGLPLLYCSATTSDAHPHGVGELLHLVEGIGAKAVFWNKDPTPEGTARHECWKDSLERRGSTTSWYQGQSSLLYDVDMLKLNSGFNHGHFGTLMPFLKKCSKDFGPPPRPTPYLETFRLLEKGKSPQLLSKVLSTKKSSSNERTVTISTELGDLHLVTIRGRQKWDVPIRERCPMSEQTAHIEMETFVRNGMKHYEKDRSRADKEGSTSMLSRHFRIGTLSPNQLYWRIEDSGMPYERIKTMSRRLIWRDLAYYHLVCFPDMRTRCIRPHYEEMEWVGGAEEDRRFEAWKNGMTGYPIVDAGMRELYATGWMTQSVRMVVASFLTEYLRCDWKKGCEWFHYTLVDADSAINAMMWQNAGRSGIDQWNFVLSPKTASQDPSGEYTKRWVPELAALPTTNLVHRPWEATAEVLEQAGVILGQTYPHRIVIDLKLERQLSIENTLAMRRKSQEYNSDRGYDLIDLPNGQKTVVFTKKEYRIDDQGNLLKQDNSSEKKTSHRTKSNRSKKRRKAKATTKTQ